MIEARRKQILRNLSTLEMVTLSYQGGQQAQQAYKDLLNEYYLLQGVDRRREEIEDNWGDLKKYKRG